MKHPFLHHCSILLSRHFFALSPYLVISLISLLLHFGLTSMYFHQDDLTYLINSNTNLLNLLTAPVNEHLHYTFTLLFKLQWQLFHLYFAPYFLISVVLHLLNLWLLWLIVKQLTKDSFLAWIAVLLFILNNNWNETILWISGQTITLSSFFVFFAIYRLLQLKEKPFSFKKLLVFIPILTLPSLTSALGLWLPVVILPFYGLNFSKRKLNWIGVSSLLSLLTIFLFYSTQSSGLNPDSQIPHFTFSTLITIVSITFLAPLSTALGSLFVPWDLFRTRAIILIFLTFSLLTTSHKKILSFLKNKDNLFFLSCLFAYYLVIAVGRFQFGLGIAKANRYAYIGLFFLLILAARFLNQYTHKPLKAKIILFSLFIILIQISGFYSRAIPYTTRPTQVRSMIEQLQTLTGCYQDGYLPDFVSPIPVSKYSDLLPLINNPNLTVNEDPRCKTFH